MSLYPHGKEMYNPKNDSLLFEIKGITSFSTSAIVIVWFFDFICFWVTVSGFSLRVTFLKSFSNICFLNPVFNPFALIDLNWLIIFSSYVSGALALNSLHRHSPFSNFKHPKHFLFLPGSKRKIVSTEKLEVSM